MAKPIAVEQFPANSRRRCCGTCRSWLIKRVRKFPHKAISVTWCPICKQELPDDLTACGCAGWRKEPRESFSLELYAELDRTLPKEEEDKAHGR